MIIYLSQGTQTTQNTQMNADLYFLRCLRSPNQPAKFPFNKIVNCKLLNRK